MDFPERESALMDLPARESALVLPPQRFPYPVEDAITDTTALALLHAMILARKSNGRACVVVEHQVRGFFGMRTEQRVVKSIQFKLW
ncbi:MAG: hypothetical protein HY520_01385 [Candidatus Aenigmarchaeota archaeon]|nr:hypothetical protein [Candidatus Aenigmarchaeota archaeon]